MRNLLRLTVLIAALAVPGLLAAPAGAALKKAFWNELPDFSTLQQLGVDIWQVQLRWERAAPTRPANPEDPNDPAYRWPKTVEDGVPQAGPFGMKPMIMLIGAPGWANGGREANWAPTDPADYAAFARAAARRYPNVRLWMAWGEPTNPGIFQPNLPFKAGDRPRLTVPAGSREVPRRYAQLLDAAYGALKGESPQNKIIGGNTFTGGTISTPAWIKALKLPGGKRPRLDMYGHNPFIARRPDYDNPPSVAGYTDFSDLQRLEKTLDANLRGPRGRRLKLFLSEFTIETGASDLTNRPVSVRTQASWLKSAFKVARSDRRIDTLGWIFLRDRVQSPGAPAQSGGLMLADGTPKPAFSVFQRGR